METYVRENAIRNSQAGGLNYLFLEKRVVMNTAVSCLYSEVSNSSTDDQRSPFPNVSDLPPSAIRYPPRSIRCRPAQSRVRAVTRQGDRSTRQKSGFVSVLEHRSALALSRSKMATSTSRSATRTTSEPARSKTATRSASGSLAMPCPSNAVRACVAGTKYSVGKPKSKAFVHTNLLYSVKYSLNNVCL